MPAPASVPYVTVPIKDLGGGLDQFSSENALQEGFSEDLLNADPKPEGYLVKRNGYQGYAGFVPLRVTRLEYTSDLTNNICFYLDGSIDLSNTHSTPLVVYGRTSAHHSTGDWTDTSQAHYYNQFTADPREVFQTGSNTVVQTSADTGEVQPYYWVGTSESTDITQLSNSVFFPDSISVSQVDSSLTLQYTNGTGSPFSYFTYFLDRPNNPGTTYVSPPITYTTGTHTSTIPTSTHQLNDFNILVKSFVDNGSTLEEMSPDSVTIDNTGSVQVTITNGSASSVNVRHVLTAAPISNVKAGQVMGLSTASVVISNLSTPFLFLSCYLEQTLGGTKEQVIPDSIAIDAVAKTATVTFDNTLATTANFFIYYINTELRNNKLCVTGAAIADDAQYTDNSPQLTIWGINQDNIYTDTTLRGGWVTHIDAYRSAGENRLVCGLGGNLFDARTIEESGTTYLLPVLYPNLNSRILSDTVVGPVFFDTTDSPTRTRGFIKFDGGGGNFAQGTAATFDSGNGWVKYTLSTPNININGTLSTIINTTAHLADQLIVQQSGYSVNQGTFTIKQVNSPDANTLLIWVQNSARSDSDFDESDSGMQCGIFTDQLPLTATAPFINGDRIRSDILSESDKYTAINSYGTILQVTGTSEEKTLPSGVKIAAERTSIVMPLRDVGNSPSVINLVAGDLLGYIDSDLTSNEQLKRELRVVSINPDVDRNVSISGDGTTATVTLLSGTTVFLQAGQKVSFYQCSLFDGAQTIQEVVDSTTFTFASSVNSSVSGILEGNTIELDESILFADRVDSSVSVQVNSRWIPIEAPDVSGNLPQHTYFQHLDGDPYNDQPILRSVMSADNMYVTNGTDDVFKYDGEHIYRAGLIRWQPHLFVTTDNAPPAPNTGQITITDISCATTGWDNNRFTTSIADSTTFVVGSIISNSFDSATYTVVSISSDTTNGYITVDKNITGATAAATLTQVTVFSYYFRLNAIDVNQNIIASAVTGSQDFKLQLATDAQVRIRLIGLPAWDNLDFDRLEVQVYRTKSNGVAPFYRLVTLPMQFNNGQGYLDFVDTQADVTLTDLDEVNTALIGQELGQQWSHPLEAKYITSTFNRVVLGNFKSDPALDIQMIDTGLRITPSTLDGSIFKFRKDETDTATTTDMINRANYQFTMTASGAVSNITSDSTTFTVTTSANHGLAAGNWVYLYRDAVINGAYTHFMGWFMVNTVGALNQFTVLDPGNYTFDGTRDVNAWVKATDPRDIPVFLGTDGNYGMVNGNTDFTLFSYEFTAQRRLANAINSSMRKVDVTVTGMGSFKPWMIGNAGNEFNFGQLVVTQPKRVDTFLAVKFPTFTDLSLFINGIVQPTAGDVSALRTLFPSRILISFPNYPEIFDNPTATLDSQSLSAIDVNPSDGQEITGTIPFFGDSTFGAALKNGIIVVFKQNSIYLVDLDQKVAGNNPIQRIESQGLGCTAPFSIAPTRDGIMFANESGVYRLNRSLTVDYLGRKLERIWREQIDRTRLDIATGHYFTNGNQYKLSTALPTDAVNDKVLVYNTVREYGATIAAQAVLGSWARYDNHPAIGWANLLTDEYFASTKGQVFIQRNNGDVSDFRDDASGINMQALIRAMDFGDSAIRKVVASVLIQYRTIADSFNTKVYAAADLTNDFQELDDVTIDVPQDQSDDLSDMPAIKVETMRYVTDKRKVVYSQLMISNSAIDEPLEIAGISFRVVGLTEMGTTQAADTGKSS